MTSEKMRILIVADDVQLAQSLAAMIEAAGGYAVCVLHSAADVVAAAIACPPAIAFLDVELSGGSAHAVALRFRQHVLLQATRLIALTANIELSDREFARAAGFERYLVTPVTTNELHKVLRRRTSIAA